MSRNAEISLSENPETSASTTRRRFLKTVIHAFVGFHLVAIMCWSLTSGSSKAPLNEMVRKRLARYIVPPGFGQQWNMFAPHPPMSNNYLQAEVTFVDGGHATWTFPRMNEISYLRRYRSERHRKWVTESVVAGGKPVPVVAEAAARYAARQVERPGNPPRKVELVRFRSQIPSPKLRPLPPSTDAPRDWDRQSLCICEFDDAGRVTRRWPQTQPAATQPGATQPGATQPGAAQPGDALLDPAADTPAGDLLPRQEGGR